jgi:peptidoglycan/xylan/chitin deacetylase (PgdA/CDA1 family)
MRRGYVERVRKSHSEIWPIDKTCAKPPSGWMGWPDGKRFAFVITHDIEAAKGQKNCYSLAETEKKYGFRSSFNFTPGNYRVDPGLRQFLVREGFEVGLHGLSHKGNLFKSRNHFMKQVGAINGYLKEWQAVGFRTPSMYHNLEWIHELEIEYDLSTFDTDPFEPQPDGIGTVFPLWCKNGADNKGYVELPYTLPQDYLLFVLMRERTTDIWKEKLAWLVEHGGMVLFITHPDYMNSTKNRCEIDEYPIEYYEEFLKFVKEKYEGEYWHSLPREVARFWKRNRTLNLSAPMMGTRQEEGL